MRRSILNFLVVVAVLLASAVAIEAEGLRRPKRGRHDQAITDCTRAIEAVSIIKV